MATKSLVVRFIGETSSLHKDIDALHSKFASFKSIVTTVAAAGAALGAVSFFKTAIDEAVESARVTRQTEAVLKSTGGVAKVSAGQINTLATALSNKAGVDDELIQSGANVLLTFTRVRNEAGKGNDVFNRGTTAALDMSAALGTDLQASIIQVGKALNDPIKGMVGLSKAGVQFTSQQKDEIKVLVEKGDLLGAQKIILGELQTQFGGMAAASADAGAKLKVAFNNMAEDLGRLVLPAFTGVVDFLTNNVIPVVGQVGASFGAWLTPKLQEFANWARDKVLPVLADIGVWIRDQVLPRLQNLGDALGPVLKDVVESAIKAFTRLKEFAAPMFTGILDAVTGTVKMIGNITSNNDMIGEILVSLGLVIVAIKGAETATKLWNTALAANPVLLFGTAIVGTLLEMQNQVEKYGVKGSISGGQIADTVSNNLGSVIKLGDGWNAFTTWFTTNAIPGANNAFNNLTGGFDQGRINMLAGLGDLGHWFGTTLGNIGSWFGNLDKTWQNSVTSMSTWAINLGARFGELKETILRKVLEWVDWLSQLPGRLRDIGNVLMQSLGDGMKDAARNVWNWIKDIGNDIINAVKDFFGIKSPSKVFAELGGNMIQGLIKGLVSSNPTEIIQKVFGGMTNALGSIVSKGWVSLAGMPDKALNALQGAANWVGKLFGLGGDGGGAGGAGQWAGMVSQVLAMLGQPQSLVPNVLRRINQESGGNPNAFNNWDSNAMAGIPSQGLMQTVPGTFAAYAGPFKGRGIMDPFASIYAGVNYAIQNYPSLQYAMDKPGGYRDGGWLDPGQFGYNETSQPEAILNKQQWNALAGSGGSTTTNHYSLTVHAQTVDHKDIQDYFNRMQYMDAP